MGNTTTRVPANFDDLHRGCRSRWACRRGSRHATPHDRRGPCREGRCRRRRRAPPPAGRACGGRRCRPGARPGRGGGVAGRARPGRPPRRRGTRRARRRRSRRGRRAAPPRGRPPRTGSRKNEPAVAISPPANTNAAAKPDPTPDLGVVHSGDHGTHAALRFGAVSVALPCHPTVPAALPHGRPRPPRRRGVQGRAHGRPVPRRGRPHACSCAAPAGEEGDLLNPALAERAGRSSGWTRTR